MYAYDICYSPLYIRVPYNFIVCINSCVMWWYKVNVCVEHVIDAIYGCQLKHITCMEDVMVRLKYTYHISYMCWYRCVCIYIWMPTGKYKKCWINILYQTISYIMYMPDVYWYLCVCVNQCMCMCVTIYIYIYHHMHMFHNLHCSFFICYVNLPSTICHDHIHSN